MDMLKQVQKENRECLKELSVLDKSAGSSRKQAKTSASKAESSSSGRGHLEPTSRCELFQSLNALCPVLFYSSAIEVADRPISTALMSSSVMNTQGSETEIDYSIFA